MSDTTVSMECRNCDAKDGVTVPTVDVEEYMEGRGSMFCQDRFPFLNVRGREILIQAHRKRNDMFHWYMCPTCWEKMGEDE
jgi:hypothetical protein